MVKYYKQTGKTTPIIDAFLDAKHPGWRISKTKHRYFEARKNRSDARGRKV